MKKLTTMAFVVISTTLGLSQEIKYGIKSGVNYSSLLGGDNIYHGFKGNTYDPDELGAHKGEFGLHIGGFAEYQLNEKRIIQPELLFSTQGASFENYHSNYYISTQKIKITNFNLPIIFKYNVIKNINLEVGPQVGIIIFANNTYDTYNSYYNEHEHFELGLKTKSYTSGLYTTIYNKMSRFDFGFNIGASYNITKNFFVQGRYLGLTGINILNASEYYHDEYKEIIPNVEFRDKLKNSVFQLGVGYKF